MGGEKGDLSPIGNSLRRERVVVRFGVKVFSSLAAASEGTKI